MMRKKGAQELEGFELRVNRFRHVRTTTLSRRNRLQDIARKRKNDAQP